MTKQEKVRRLDRAAQRLVDAERLRSSGKAPERGVKFDVAGDSATLNGVCEHIRTLDQLLRHARVNMSLWDVKRQTVNTWEGYIKSGTPGHERIRKVTLWQIKALLTRKMPEMRATEELVKRIEHGARFSTPTIRRRNFAVRRSLELAIFDPHLGLVCEQPEADAPQDLESAARLIITAEQDLIERTKVFGPYEQAVIPFGNDFVHADTVFHTTTAGTPQPEALSYHRTYVRAEEVAIEMVERARQVAKTVYVYEIPGNHSRVSDFTLARVIRAYFRRDKGVVVDASSSPYKFHRFGVNLIGFEHGHSVKTIRLAALMANERPADWRETRYREWHIGDQHRKGSMNPMTMEEQGVSVEFIQGLTAPNEWHRLKSFSHQKRGAMAFVWDYTAGPIARCQFNISQYDHKPLR